MPGVTRRICFLFISLLSAYCCGACTIRADQQPDLDRCLTAADCVLAIRTDVCCACPHPMALARVEQASHLEVYIRGRNYGLLLPSRCALVDCAVCEGLEAEVVCQAGRCGVANPSAAFSPLHTRFDTKTPVSRCP
jgi:hypothetical protein